MRQTSSLPTWPRYRLPRHRLSAHVFLFWVCLHPVDVARPCSACDCGAAVPVNVVWPSLSASVAAPGACVFTVTVQLCDIAQLAFVPALLFKITSLYR